MSAAADDEGQGGDAVLFRARPRRFLTAGGLLSVAVVVLGVVNLLLERSWHAGLVLAWFSYSLVRLLRLHRLRERQDWSVRVGADGIRWRASGRLVPWSQVVEVRVEPRRGLRRLLADRPDRILVLARYQDLLEPSAATEPLARVIDPGDLTAGTEEILAAVRRFCPSPVLG